ncbi:uncharacterized protein F5Z01DRAFT_433234 [Emericellopsis atlantica]|uniref:Uncharacterized protein n=1 Tax=Emericellopsis atlantica TaxID=2614577 RepID=A0A9P7ZDP7_9HYPO|nr:uncharacterized protein F5Z01DRAFT_433234 [Emericellopsis atlantica]KAG9250031.1 hypothetical protein F5Z01DRAFT_433234 [Emericellopsis atlantica]
MLPARRLEGTCSFSSRFSLSKSGYTSRTLGQCQSVRKSPEGMDYGERPSEMEPGLEQARCRVAHPLTSFMQRTSAAATGQNKTRPPGPWPPMPRLAHRGATPSTKVPTGDGHKPLIVGCPRRHAPPSNHQGCSLAVINEQLHLELDVPHPYKPSIRPILGSSLDRSVQPSSQAQDAYTCQALFSLSPARLTSPYPTSPTSDQHPLPCNNTVERVDDLVLLRPCT